MYTKITLLLLLSLCSEKIYAKKKAQQSPPAPTPTYSCSAVLADNYYVPEGQTVIVNAQVDCLFFTGLGRAAMITTIPITIPANSMIKIPPFTQDKAYTPETPKSYPAQGQMVSFEYQSSKGALKGIPIQVVIRSEPLDQSLIDILKTHKQQTRAQQNDQKEQELEDIINHPSHYAKVVFYRRLPTLGEAEFTPKHTKLFKNPEQHVADIRILPTGNLHIIDHAPTGEKFLVEEPFGKL